jgi:hypothetical protein
MSKSSPAVALIHVPDRFSVVEPGVYRSASPTASQVSSLEVTSMPWHRKLQLLEHGETLISKGAVPSIITAEDDHLSHSRISGSAAHSFHSSLWDRVCKSCPAASASRSGASRGNYGMRADELVALWHDALATVHGLEAYNGRHCQSDARDVVG